MDGESHGAGALLFKINTPFGDLLLTSETGVHICMLCGAQDFLQVIGDCNFWTEESNIRICKYRHFYETRETVGIISNRSLRGIS